MATEEEIVRFELDAKNLKAQIDTLTAQVSNLDKEVKDVGATFNKVGQNVQNNMTGSTAAVKTLGKAVSDTEKNITKLAQKGSLNALNEELKKVKEQMNAVNTEGKLFKALNQRAAELESSIKKVVAPTESLKQQLIEVRKALLTATDPKEIQRLTQEAAKLDDEVGDTLESVKELAGSNLEALQNTLGSLGSKIASLDFEGAAQKAKQLEVISSQMTFKEAVKGIKDLGSSFLSLGKALLTNPLFLTAGALAAIGVAVYKLITAEDEEITKLKELKQVLQERFDLTIKGLDRTIAREKAAGNQTALLEAAKLKTTRDNLKEQLKIEKRILDIETEKAIRILATVRGEQEARKTVNESYKEQIDNIKKLEDDLYSTETNILTNRIEFFKSSLDAGIAADDEYRDKQKENAEKALENRKKIAEREKQLRDAEIQGDIEAEQERLKQIEKLKQDSEIRQNDISRIIDDEFRTEQAEQVAFVDEAEVARFEETLQREKELKDELIRMEQDYQLARTELWANAGKQIGQTLIGVFATMGANQEQMFILEKAAAIGEIIINNRLAAAKLSIAQAEATALLGNPVTAVAGAALQAKVLLERGQLAAQLASSLAVIGAQTVAGAFKLHQEFNEGTPFVTGQRGIDKIPAKLTYGEAVIPAEENAKYNDHVKAMISGTYDDYLKLNYIAPALRDAAEQSKQHQSMGLADNIVKSFILNSKNGLNDSGILYGLASMDKNEEKRNERLIKEFRKSRRINIRNT